MDDHEAIERYNRAGEQNPGEYPGVRWPDLALNENNLVRLAEGVLGARFDWARLAFGDDFDEAAVEERLSESWRTDAVQLRYAPEGVFLRARFAVLVEIGPEEDEPEDESCSESLHVTLELCVSFTSRHHVRPFFDFMSGEVCRVSDHRVTKIDPFSNEVSPSLAVAWGLNGADAMP